MVVDYILNGVFLFVLKKGKLFICLGMIWVIGYLFNIIVVLGDIFVLYIYNIIKIDIFNMNNDFMIYDLGDIVNVNSFNYNFLVIFK